LVRGFGERRRRFAFLCAVCVPVPLYHNARGEPTFHCGRDCQVVAAFSTDRPGRPAPGPCLRLGTAPDDARDPGLRVPRAGQASRRGITALTRDSPPPGLGLSRGAGGVLSRVFPCSILSPYLILLGSLVNDLVVCYTVILGPPPLGDAQHTTNTKCINFDVVGVPQKGCGCLCGVRASRTCSPLSHHTAHHPRCGDVSDRHEIWLVAFLPHSHDVPSPHACART